LLYRRANLKSKQKQWKKPMEMLNRLRERLAVKAELRRLRSGLQQAASPAPAELVRLTGNRAVWRVTVTGQHDRFMSAELGLTEDTTFVVHVNADAFYLAWLAADSNRQRRSDACVLRSAMPRDYKFHRAVAGFSHGIKNPVPLALPGAFRLGNSVHIGFTNGITRTFWLLANNASTFPVKVYGRESAELLNQVAGLEAAPKSFAELFAEARDVPALSMDGA
jgi:plasmid fertility inhibition factor